MAKKSSIKKVIGKHLKKEVALPIKMPDNKFGSILSNKRGIFFGKYLHESWVEIKKVTWPNRKETVRLMFAVIIFTAIFTLIISIADVGIGVVVERILI